MGTGGSDPGFFGELGPVDEAGGCDAIDKLEGSECLEIESAMRLNLSK